MSSCGCNKQGGGGFKKCSCKKCRRYTQKGGFWPFDPTPTTPTTSTTSQRQSENIQPETIEEKKERLQILQNQSAALEEEIRAVEPQIPSPVISTGEMRGGGGGNMMSRMEMSRGGYGELGTIRQDATIGLDSGPSIATQGLVSQAGGKRKTRRMKKSRKHKKSRKYRR
jgi:hypothetical protein